MTRVVVTGMGIVSPVGIGREAFWSSLIAGQSGIGPITLFDASSFPVRFGGEVKGSRCRPARTELSRRQPGAAIGNCCWPSPPPNKRSPTRPAGVGAA